MVRGVTQTNRNLESHAFVMIIVKTFGKPKKMGMRCLCAYVQKQVSEKRNILG